ncbi:MAG TPA: hypothetical protein VGO59_19415 [Verrucomicrobiae bacterium]|jgi:hypothetical protein
MNKFTIAAVLAIVTASAAISFAIQRQAGARMRGQTETMRQQSEQSAQLSAENGRLSNLMAGLKSSQRLSKEQLAGLLKLRDEIGRLRQNGKIKTQLQETNARLRAIAARSEKQLAEAQAEPNYWPKDQLAYAGYSDPESSMKSMLAAMNSGDVASWRQSCTPEAIAQLTREWQERGLTEAQQDAEVKLMAGMLMSSASGFHIIGEETAAPDEMTINLSFDGEGKARKFVLRKIGNEWKFHDLIMAGQE